MAKDKFLSCSANKEQFITLLCKLANGERVRMETFTAHNDCDTLIFKKATELSETMSVEVVAEDSDILVMLLHHVTRAPRDILLRTKGDIYSIQDIHDALTEREKERVLFIHSFSGCDTVSSIYRQSKVGFLQTTKNWKQYFLSQDALQEEIVVYSDSYMETWM